MAGQIKHLINTIIAKRSRGDKSVAALTEVKIILKGIDPDKYTALSADDPATIAKVKTIAAELGVSL